MKKIILITIIISIFCSVSFAESNISFENMTNQEVLNYYELIMEQIKKRKLSVHSINEIDGQMIEPGVYVVGDDIPAGNYFFEGVEGRFPSSINVLSSLADRNYIMDFGSFGYGDYEQTTKSGKIILEDGWYLEVVQGPAVIHNWEGFTVE